MISFNALRHDPANHLGLGDIRLTIGQQEEIEAALQQARNALAHVIATSETETVPDGLVRVCMIALESLGGTP